MNALRTTASLQSSPERTPRQVRLQASPRFNEDGYHRSSTEVLMHSLSCIQSSDDEDEIEEVEEEESLEEIVEESTLLCTPPTIRRRRKPNGNNDTSRSLSFMEETEQQDMNGDEMIFPTPLYKGARLETLQTTPTCLALFAFIVAILVACALLSHFYTSTDILVVSLDQQEATAMSLSEQQVLLKAYLGDLDGGASTSNVKLPAGGNPIDLIHLLHSQTAEHQEEEGIMPAISTALPTLKLSVTLTLVVLCSLVLAEMT